MRRLFLLAALVACAREPALSAKGYQGIVELHERRLAFEMPGRVRELKTVRGAHVEQGQVIAVLDDSLERPQRDARAAEARAADAQLDLLRAGPKGADVRSLEAQVRAARAGEETLRDAVERSRKLVGTVPPAQLEQQEGQLSRAVAERQSLEERLTSLRSGARSQEVRTAAARAAQAQAALAAADARLQRFTLVSPIAGAILDTHVEPGEVVQPGTPVATLGETHRPFLDVFVPQPDLEGLHAGTVARVRTDASQQPLRGAIETIGRVAEFTPRFLFSEKERPNLVVRVRIAIEDSGEALHAGVPGFATFERDAQAQR